MLLGSPDEGEEANIATLGWCFGGGWSLKTAIQAKDKASACVIYYGSPVEKAEEEQNLWVNDHKYEAPLPHSYPKNPFSNDKYQSQIHHSLTPGAFNVGLKFQGKPHEMLKLVCLTLVHIEIEWQYD